jgi:hypothetical protein
LSPFYDYRCPTGHKQTKYFCLSDHVGEIGCPCGEKAEQVISAPIMVKIAADVCYDSPIDGKPITSWAARQEDLARSGCRPYDPEMKTDAERHRKEADATFDQAIEATVEESIHKMPTKKRGALMSELTEQGADLGYTRSLKEA